MSAERAAWALTLAAILLSAAVVSYTAGRLLVSAFGGTARTVAVIMVLVVLAAVMQTFVGDGA